MPQIRQRTTGHDLSASKGDLSTMPSILTPLTPKEHEVLHWGSLDKSSWEIAQILGCTEATINFHFSNIRRKFKVYSRNAAVLKAIKLGLIEL